MLEAVGGGGGGGVFGGRVSGAWYKPRGGRLRFFKIGFLGGGYPPPPPAV